MSRIIFARAARDDLVEIWKYLQPRSLDSAVCVIEQIEASIRKLAEMPGMGHTRTDVRDPRFRF